MLSNYIDNILQKLIIKLYFRYEVNKSAIPLSTVKNMLPLRSHAVLSKIKEQIHFPLFGYLQINKFFT